MINLPEYFSRHTLFYGEDFVRKLRDKTVLVAGVGGLGSTVSQLLTRTGVGKLVLLENKIIDEPDLNRQILYSYKDLEKQKSDVAKQKLRNISPYTKVELIKKVLNPDNVSDLNNKQYDIIVDCFDNFESRFILEGLLKEKQQMIHSGISNNYGQITTIKKGKTKSLKEIFGGIKRPSNNPIPVVPAAVVAVASIAANEAINALLGRAKLLNKLLIVDFEDYTMSKISLN